MQGTPIIMTPEARRTMFSKDYLTVKDVQALLGLCYAHASSLMTAIRRKAKMNGTIRLNVEGKLHVQDYIEYYNLPQERYLPYLICVNQIDNGDSANVTVSERRQLIFAKDYLTTVEVMELIGVCQTTASQIMCDIRKKYGRIKQEGKIHVQDYIDYYNLPLERYLPYAITFGSQSDKRGECYVQ